MHDTDRAVEFYRDVLGLRLLFRAPPSLAFFDCGGVRLMLTPPDAGGVAGTSILFYTVDDIQRAYAWLCAREVRFDAERGSHGRPRPVDRDLSGQRGQHPRPDDGITPVTRGSDPPRPDPTRGAVHW